MATGRVLLLRLRTGAGLSQQQLAARSGVSARTIGNLERGTIVRPNSSTVQSLVTALRDHSSLAALLPDAFSISQPVAYAQLLSANRGRGLSWEPLDAILAELHDETVHEWQDIVATHHVDVGIDGRITRSTVTRLIRPLSREASRISVVKVGDDSTPAPLTRLASTRGCTLVEEVHLPEDNITVIALDVPQSNRQQPVTVSYQFVEAPDEIMADPELQQLASRRPLSDGITRSVATAGATLVVTVQFVRPPRRAWNLSFQAGSRAVERGDLVEPDETGLLQTIIENSSAGGIGFMWDW